MSSDIPLNPVLMVHGIWDTGKKFSTLSAHLKALGRSVYDLDLVPNTGDARLEVLAKQVADFINSEFDPATYLDLIGFSMGGLVSRYYVQRLEGIHRVHRLITVSSPHRGTWIAYGSNRPGCVQMRPNSAFLKDLNQDVDLLEQLNFTSIWTPLDVMIIPASSSRMPIGQEITVRVPVHARMISDPRGLQAIATALAEPRRVNK